VDASADGPLSRTAGEALPLVAFEPPCAFPAAGLPWLQKISLTMHTSEAVPSPAVSRLADILKEMLAVSLAPSMDRAS
jgi:hypothetical protein